MRMWERSVSFWMAAYASSSLCCIGRQIFQPGRGCGTARVHRRFAAAGCPAAHHGASARTESCGIPRGRQCPRTESRRWENHRDAAAACARKLSSWLAREGGCVNEKRLRQADREISVIPIWPLLRFSILCCRIRRSASGTRMIVSDGKVSVCVISSPFALYYTGNAGKSHGRTTGSIPATLLLA